MAHSRSFTIEDVHPLLINHRRCSGPPKVCGRRGNDDQTYGTYGQPPGQVAVDTRVSQYLPLSALMAGKNRDVTNRQLLSALTMIDDSSGVATAPEIAESVGMDASQVRRRMPELVENNFVETKKTGARSRVYWLTEQGRLQLYG